VDVIQLLAISPAATARACLSLPGAPIAVTAATGNRTEPYVSVIRPRPHSIRHEYVLLASVLLLIPAGALGAMLPSLARDATGRRRFHAANCANAGFLLSIFAVITTALGSEIYHCEFRKVPNCDSPVSCRRTET